MSELQAHLHGQPWPVSLRQVLLQQALALRDHGAIYWTVGAALVLALTVLAVGAPWPKRNGAPTSDATAAPRRPWMGELLFLALLVATVAWFRWPALALGTLNIDEDMFLFGIRRLGADPIYWRSVNGTTSGPLNFYVPMLLIGALGLAPDYAALRLVGLGLTLGAIVATYFTLKALFEVGVARAACLLPVLAAAAATTSDFVHYSSELVSIFLIATAAWAIARVWRGAARGRTWSCLIAGVALGGLPLAKLQSVPIGLFLALVGYAAIVFAPGRARAVAVRLALVFTAGGLLLPVINALVLTAFGLWPEFWNGYVLANLRFSRKLFPWSVYSLRQDILWLDEIRLLLKTTVAGMVLPAGVCLLGWRRLSRRDWCLGILAGLWVGVSLFCILKPGTNWPHYFLFVNLPLAFLVAAVLGAAAAVHPPAFGPALGRLAAPRALVAMAALLLVTAAVRHRLREPESLLDRVAAAPRVLGAPHWTRLLLEAGSGARLAVWGCMPQVYTWTGLTPAVRDFQTLLAMVHPMREYFAEWFRDDLQTARPELLLEAISPRASFFRERERYGIERFPAVADTVRRLYRPVIVIDGMQVWRRVDRPDGGQTGSDPEAVQARGQSRS